MTTRRPSPGRPRHIPSTSTASPREQVLEAAAELFVTRGFAATSTREIAERVGIRQASLYYHFAGKDEILAELLQRSVRPTVDKIAKIEALVPPETHETALYLLALVDVRTLAEAPHNVGILCGLPDVTNCEIYAEFRDARQELVDAYGRLGLQVASPKVANDTDARHLGEMLTHSIEVVTTIRNVGMAVTGDGANSIAASCLRICGAPEVTIASAASTAGELLAEFRNDIATVARTLGH
ncbi:TetR/AcrR family transcriptional regulator [Nocardioides sp. NPDC000445]|uniref:TetR/AcrR family transcriptional regulator n=1 Tax=Nocardioides sp. NPDC000445 TaxID=3154257 RepID=UPI003322065E